jgi:hypothetical protein
VAGEVGVQERGDVHEETMGLGEVRPLT